MSFDITKLDTRTRSQVGVPMTITRPSPPYAPFLDDAGNPVTITLLGRNSDVFRRISREAQQRAADMAARQIPRTTEESKAERFETLVAMTVSWSFDTFAGEPFPCTPENIRKLWADDRWEWLADAAFSWIISEGNFLAA
jgi:hypothetical protein